jgi:hypothetical protein
MTSERILISSIASCRSLRGSLDGAAGAAGDGATIALVAAVTALLLEVVELLISSSSRSAVGFRLNGTCADSPRSGRIEQAEVAMPIWDCLKACCMRVSHSGAHAGSARAKLRTLGSFSTMDARALI